MATHRATEEEKEALEKFFIQFLNLEKRYPLLPGINNTEALAGIMGLSLDELEGLRDRFSENARQAALEMLEEEHMAELIDMLPFQPDDTIVALGDSATDDLQGWFSIFSHALDITVPEADFTFINSGIANDTSTDALRRLNRDVLAHDPDWVLVALGTFDAQRLHVAPDRPITSLADFWDNINNIQEAVEEVTDNPIVWITPPPVITELQQQIELFNYTIEEKDLRQFREVLSGKVGYVVDPKAERMGGNPPEAWYYLGDGLHPSLSGQVNTAKEIIKKLAASNEGVEGAEFEDITDA